jgi:predicted DNA-binding protein (UPF0251 family)
MKLKGRPKKYRIVQKEPQIDRFSPRGKAGRPDEVELSMDEFEAIRLAYYIGKSQKEAARSMRISQQTFSRILKRAHKVIADVLVNGKIIKIQGGRYLLGSDSAKIPAAKAPRTLKEGKQ